MPGYLSRQDRFYRPKTGTDFNAGLVFLLALLLAGFVWVRLIPWPAGFWDGVFASVPGIGAVKLAMAGGQAVPPKPSFIPTTPDWRLADGWFYTQTNGKPPLESPLGYAVSDGGGVPFWTAYQSLGGHEQLGYPLTNRFEWGGLPTQIFQRGAVQWWPATDEVRQLNLLDLVPEEMDQRLLEERSVPLRLPGDFDAGKDWDQTVADRLALLDQDPILAAAYADEPLAMERFGLPASGVVDFGNHRAIRLQRAVLQHWTEDTPWAKAGTVTRANVGAMLLELSVFPADAIRTVEPSSGPVLAPPSA